MSDKQSRENIESQMRAMLDGETTSISDKKSSREIEDQVRVAVVTRSHAENTLLYLADRLLVEGFEWSGIALYRSVDVLTGMPQATPTARNRVVPFRKPKPSGCEH